MLSTFYLDTTPKLKLPHQ